MLRKPISFDYASMNNHPATRNLNRRPTHPGALLHEVFDATGLARTQVAQRLGISRQHLHDVLEERKRVSPNLAARLGRLFARDGALWLRMQIALDLWEAERDEDVKKVKPLPAA